MRRSLAILLSACLTVLALLAVSPSAEAATPITGRLIDVTGSGAVSGTEVRLFESVAGEPGPAAVATAVTGPDGSFSLDPGVSTASQFFVKALAGDYQAGWVGNGALQPSRTFADPVVPGDLGDINANPAFIRGIVVNAATKNPVRGVQVTVRSADAITVVDGSDLSNADGHFRINGLTCEDDCALKINGSAKGFESGFRACNARVVRTWGAACASPLGSIGRVFLDRL